MIRALLPLLLLSLHAAAGTVVTAHGLVLKGDVRVEGDDIVLAKGKREQRYPKGDVLLVEADDGKLLHAAGFDSRLRGYEYVARAGRVDACTQLLKAAVAARDAKLARDLLERAEADGFTGKDAEEWKKKVEGLEQRSAQPDPAGSKAVSARLGEVTSLHPSLLVARARADEAEGLRLLREALRLDGAHEGARKLLAERAPPGFGLGSPAFWLDWHLDLESKGVRTLPDDDAQLAATRRTWRKNLYGVEAGQIRIITPVQDTVTVGRCLAYGQLTCAALAEMFRTPSPRPRVSKTLLVLLYPSKEEYVAKSATSGSHEERASLETTGGHYSPMDQLSRVVWDKSPDAERRIARVFVHELTHHWVTELNPRYSNAELRISPRIPGYWIVEGLATFVEEGGFDVESGAWTFFDARAASLDVVQALRPDELLGWDLLYAADNERFMKLPRDPKEASPVVRRWHLGRHGITRARLFYEQAAATVHFLYHGEGGAHRERLMEYVTSYYTGRSDKLAIEAAFGLSAAALGGKVREYAGRVAAGWRPANP
jgi:hypothetical protein